MMEDYDVCYECGGYGDDYFINDDGELECRCPSCPNYPYSTINNPEWED